MAQNTGLTNGQQELANKGEIVGVRSDEIFVLIKGKEDFSLKSLSNNGVDGLHEIGTESDCRKRIDKLKAHYATCGDPIY